MKRKKILGSHVKRLLSGVAIHGRRHLTEVETDLLQTELLLEETENEWDPAGPSPAVVLNRHRSQHIGQLALLLPRLQNWRQCNPDPFQGSLVRG
jgi:hypothetical protein